MRTGIVMWLRKFICIVFGHSNVQWRFWSQLAIAWGWGDERKINTCKRCKKYLGSQVS